LKSYKEYLLSESSKKDSDKRSKDKDDTSQNSAIMELAEKLQSVFKKYSLITRRAAWNKLNTKKGDEAIDELIKNPARSLNAFKKLSNQGNQGK